MLAPTTAAPVWSMTLPETSARKSCAKPGHAVTMSAKAAMTAGIGQLPIPRDLRLMLTSLNADYRSIWLFFLRCQERTLLPAEYFQAASENKLTTNSDELILSVGAAPWKTPRVNPLVRS